jgi:transposase
MEKYTTRDFDRDFPTDDSCLEFLFKQRWPDGVTCEKCQKVTNHYRITDRPCYSCEFCGNHVYPMAGTIFEGTRFSHLRLWFKAVAYMAVTRCGISSRQLSRDLGVTVKTGWRMFHQIRKVLADDGGQLSGDVEIDETYIGGKAKNMHKAKREKLGGRGTAGKTVVLGMVERKGRVQAKIIPNTDRETLEKETHSKVVQGSAVFTDGHSGYDHLDSLGYQHEVVPHSQGIYVLGEDIHTNTIEGFWSQLKRSIDGSYHHVTTKYLPLYVDEYAFRYGHRKDEQNMFWTMIERVISQAS